MALPIQTTPILGGKDAEEFLRKKKEVEEGKNPVSPEEYERAVRAYGRLNDMHGDLF